MRNPCYGALNIGNFQFSFSRYIIQNSSQVRNYTYFTLVRSFSVSGYVTLVGFTAIKNSLEFLIFANIQAFP